MKSEEILSDPVKMLREIEAYLTFRLLSDYPYFPEDDMQEIKNDIARCLRKQGIKVDYIPYMPK